MYKTDLTNEEYHADKSALSSTDIKTVYKQSLFHWKNMQRRGSTAFDQGTAVHAMLLEPEKDLVIKGPKDRRGNAWKDAYAKAEANGQVLLPEGEYYEVEAMAQAAMFTPHVANLLSAPDMVAEASFFVTCPQTGLRLKCRPDGFIEQAGIAFDIKTTQDASPRGFGKAVNSFGYDIQAAFYMYVLRLAGILSLDKFLFVAIEKNAPYCVQVHELSELYLASAHNRMMATLHQIAHAEKTQQFGTGWPLVNEIAMPDWLSDSAF
jgi:hypothetical protein